MPGFLRAFYYVLRLEPDALLTAGCPCSSFVFVNLATSARTASAPFGNERHQYVLDANQICCRLVLLLLATCRDSYFKVGQPASSKLFLLPYMIFMATIAQLCGLAMHNQF